MRPAELALVRVERRLVARLEELEARLDGEDPEVWKEYAALAAALAAVAPMTVPGAGGELLTTAQMAQRLQVAPKTLLRRAKRGKLQQPIRLGRLGERGRETLRWAAR